MKLRTLALFTIVIALLASGCNRYITPAEAANGKARCARGLH